MSFPAVTLPSVQREASASSDQLVQIAMSCGAVTEQEGRVEQTSKHRDVELENPRSQPLQHPLAFGTGSQGYRGWCVLVGPRAELREAWKSRMNLDGNEGGLPGLRERERDRASHWIPSSQCAV